MTPTALAADRLREAERCASGTVDWVEEATGIPGPSMCQRQGHAWERDETQQVRIVYGRSAGAVRCAVCGARGFHWLADEPVSAE